MTWFNNTVGDLNAQLAICLGENDSSLAVRSPSLLELAVNQDEQSFVHVTWQSLMMGFIDDTYMHTVAVD